MIFHTLPAWAATVHLQIQVKTPRGQVLDDAVVYLQPLNPQQHVSATPSLKPKLYTMNQIDQNFRPKVLVIPTGSRVSFPNQDNIKHNVYSFSDAGNFDIPLYRKTQSSAPSRTFKKSGEIVIGCKIHDWMLGYIYVVDTPYFTKTKKGLGDLKNIPLGPYKASVWHPLLRRRKPLTQNISITSTSSLLEFEVLLKRRKRHFQRQQRTK